MLKQQETKQMYDYYEDEDYTRSRMFANPGSALRRATRSNPRNLPCPTCGEPNRLTLADRRLGYQCDDCADRDEGRGY
jgi:hypothetical protein